MNSENAIEVSGLVKHFGEVHALDGVDLLARQGEEQIDRPLVRVRKFNRVASSGRDDNVVSPAREDSAGHLPHRVLVLDCQHRLPAA